MNQACHKQCKQISTSKLRRSKRLAKAIENNVKHKRVRNPNVRRHEGTTVNPAAKNKNASRERVSNEVDKTTSD